MKEKKKRKMPFDVFLSGDLFDVDLEGFEGGGGYSITVTYDSAGKPVVKVETSGNIDKGKLRKEIEKQYPGAKIIGLEKEPLLRFVDEEG